MYIPIYIYVDIYAHMMVPYILFILEGGDKSAFALLSINCGGNGKNYYI